MLVNRTFHVLLGATKTEKCRQTRYPLTEAVLPLPPDHGLFDNDFFIPKPPRNALQLLAFRNLGWILHRRRSCWALDAVIG